MIIIYIYICVCGCIFIYRERKEICKWYNVCLNYICLYILYIYQLNKHANSLSNWNYILRKFKVKVQC
jgi:hypothetical protein